MPAKVHVCNIEVVICTVSHGVTGDALVLDKTDVGKVPMATILNDRSDTTTDVCSEAEDCNILPDHSGALGDAPKVTVYSSDDGDCPTDTSGGGTDWSGSTDMIDTIGLSSCALAASTFGVVVGIVVPSDKGVAIARENGNSLP